MKRKLLFCVFLLVSFSCSKTEWRAEVGIDIDEGASINSLDNVSGEEIPDAPDEDHPVVAAVQDFANVIGLDIEGLTPLQQEQVGNDVILSSVNMLQTEYNVSTADLIEVFGSLSDPRIGAVGLILVAYEANEIYVGSSGTICDSGEKTIRCIITALIPCTIMTTALNVFRGENTTMDAKWALGVLKEFAGMTAKSTSPLGIALMVAEFTVCMATEQPEPTPGGDPTNPEYPNDPEPPLPGGSGLGAIPGAGSVQFAYGESHSRMENIIRGHEPALFTHIYYDGTQHYYDVHLICLLPDGYYSSNYTTVYKIQGGILVQVLTILECPECVYELLPLLTDPFVPCE